MPHSPEERERVALLLRRQSDKSEEEIQRIVDICLQLAPELVKIWKKRAMPKNTPWKE